LFFPGYSALSLPALDEALWRGLVAVFGTGLLLLAAWLMGMGFCQLILRWQPDDWREGLLFQAATGLGLLAYLSLGLASLGLYHAISIRILIGVVVLGGSLWFSWFWTHGINQKVKILPSFSSPVNSRSGDRVWKSMIFLAVLIAFLTALAPEKEYDALWYHLGFPKLWLAQGYLVDLPAEYVSLYPMTWELIFGAGLALGGPIAAKLLHFACLPLIGLLTYQLAWRFVPRASPWLAVVFFVTIPTVLWEASTAYIDLALAMHVGLTVYAILRYLEVPDRHWLILAAVNLGLGLATKHLALFALAIILSAMALLLWFRNRNLRQALSPVLLLGMLSLLLALPWYLRSWLASGNPVFPELFEIFGAPTERWDAITQEGLNSFMIKFGRPRTALNMLALPWDITMHASRYGGTFGPAFLLLLPVLALLRRRSQITPWLMFFALSYIGLWASPISSFQLRFLVPITPVLAILAAEACDRLALSLRTLVSHGRPALYAIIVLLLLLNLPPFITLHEGDRVGGNGWLTHVIRQIPISVVIGKESQEDYLMRTVPSYAAWSYINTHLPSDARVLTFSGGDHFYSERERIWCYAAIARPAIWATQGQEQQALRKLQELSISHVLFDKKKLDSPAVGALAIAPTSVLANRYELEYEDKGFILYRLDWERPMSREMNGSSNFQYSN
jgi:hypothetical protein